MAREILIWLVGVPLTVLTSVYVIILGEMIAARRRIKRS
jgi:hypothetical protein